jgi:hypothetical protein
MAFRSAVPLISALLMLAPMRAPAQPCGGDCDGDGNVSISELILAVNIALGRRPPSECEAADADGNGALAINELIGAVRSALEGCGSIGVGDPLIFLGDEFRANTFTDNVQDRADVAAAGSGEFIVTWESFGADNFFFGVAAQRYASSGDPLGGELVVNSFTTGQQRFPSVAVNPSGDALVVWRTDATPQSSDEQAFVTQLLDTAGTHAGGESQLVAFSGLNADVRNAAARRGDGFVVVWEEFDGDYTDIMGRVVDAGGNPIGASFVVNSFTTGAQAAPAVAGRAEHGFVVVWQSRNQDVADWKVFGQRFDDAGQAVGSEFRVHPDDTSRQVRPSVTIDGDGRFTVAWINSAGTLGNGVLVQRFSSDVTPLGPAFQADTPQVSQSGYPAIAAEPEGGFLVVWQSQGQDGPPTEFGIFARQYDSSGNAVGDEFLVNSHTPRSQFFPAVAADDDGRFTVVWTSSGQDGDEGAAGGIFGQRLGPPGEFAGRSSDIPILSGQGDQ